MSFTFTKLFSSITESTIWVESDHVRIVWITMLAMADRCGRVWGSVPGLANRARVPVESCREAIEKFLSPDPDSRTPDNEGRRIEKIDGGWRLLNHEKYRAIRDEEAAKEAKRRYINERRAREREGKQGKKRVEKVEQSRTQENGNELSRTPSIQAEAEADTEADTDSHIRSPNLGAEKPPRVRNAVLDALASVDGSNPLQIPKGAWAGIAKCLADIRTVSPEISMEDIQRRAANYRSHFPSVAISPHALAKHWARCEKPPSQTLLSDIPGGKPIPWQRDSHNSDHSKGF